ncbi:unnamed protein product [Cladocopium goreaui]|uniref:Cation-chloride cotransporter 1 n=1 Tax=Cladocopium goreaui TaxID=2562237 RepID=A0A9P1GRP1_9DINO|nr:unnamed protein product [Cladocopium goreaui]
MGSTGVVQSQLPKWIRSQAIMRHIFVESSCFVEYYEATAAEAAAGHLSGMCGLTVSFSDSSAIDYYRTLQLEGWLPCFEPSAVAISNSTTAKAERALQSCEPGSNEHFKALLQDPNFVRLFEQLLQQQGLMGKSTGVEDLWSMLLQDKPDLFNRPAHELVQASNADVAKAFMGTRTAEKLEQHFNPNYTARGLRADLVVCQRSKAASLKTMEVSCVTMAKGHQHVEVVAGTCKSARGRKAGAYSLQQQLKRDFHSTLCNGMVCFNAHHGHTQEAERWMSFLDTKQGDVPQVETLNALLAALIKKGDLAKARDSRKRSVPQRNQFLAQVTMPPFEAATYSRKSSFTDVSDTPARRRTWSTSTPKFLGNEVLSSEDLKTQRTESGLTQCRKDKKGALTGVFIPTCENMWGVLIFLRFYYIVGEAGIWQTLCAVLLSFAAAFCTTCAMSSIASSGGLVSSGGPYYMISRALGPVVGATIGIMYWLAITMLSVLECLGAVEALAMAAPSMRFPGFRQALGSASMALLALAVWGGMNIVTKLGLLFALVVVFTLFSFYLGLFMTGPGTVSPDVPGSEYITGLSWETFQSNWSPHYDSNVGFGTVLSLFYPCFTGILSGANRADVLKDPPRNIRIGTFGAIVFRFFLYTSFFLLWGSLALFEVNQISGYQSQQLMAWFALRVVWNPFPNSAFVGIIIASLSQSLQCLIVAPRLLQNMAKDRPAGSAGRQIRGVIHDGIPLGKKKPWRFYGFRNWYYTNVFYKSI